MMIRKLTMKLWESSIFLLLVIGAMTAFLLVKYLPASLQAIQGDIPKLAMHEEMSNIYGWCATGLFMLVIEAAIVVRQLTNSVGKKVRRYLAENPEVTQQQLDSDFSNAEQIGNIWIGRKWTYSYNMNDIPVENVKIVLVYTETWRVKRKINYNLCLGLVNGNVVKSNVPKNNIPQIMEAYKRFPHILSGDNPDYVYLFRKDINALLEIRYRNSESCFQE